MDDINLHFTGDIHVVTAANNLLAAGISTISIRANEPNLDKDRIFGRDVSTHE